MIQTRITKMLSAALQADTAPLATHYGAIVGIGELGQEVCVVRFTHRFIHGVSKNDTDIAHCSFDAHPPILVIFGTDVAERVCYQMMICHPTSPN